MVNREPVSSIQTLERLSRARSACRDLMETFAADRFPYSMDTTHLLRQEADE